MKKLVLLSFLACSTSLLMGCPSENERVETTTTETTTETAAQTTQATEAPATEVKNEFKVGETAKNGDYQITLNGVRKAKKIDEKGNEFQKADAGKAETFLIADVTVENVGAQQQQFSMMVAQPKIVDPDGYGTDPDYMTSTFLKKEFKDGALQPGGKIRGEVPFKVADGKKGLKLTISPNMGAPSMFFKLD